MVQKRYVGNARLHLKVISNSLQFSVLSCGPNREKGQRQHFVASALLWHLRRRRCYESFPHFTQAPTESVDDDMYAPATQP